ncbi:NUDIX domain-containing protein [Enterobacter wuhouensis]|uniref:NUDIX domain-containing protein n=1 Tax=Enterobacter wuhouensis TaxID=2529381 RepID=A0ABZ1DI13_9ENTR|nr:NUDIX domain-containing protein [Enterobacter wuhouensis]WRW31696.1 NUDIX domain-containing protein [Enterobacter wuhouensis]
MTMKRGCLAIITENNKILLVKRANPPERHCWGLPGGSLLQEELPSDAVVRETSEETGLKVKALISYFPFKEKFHNKNDVLSYEFILYPIKCEIESGFLKANDDAIDLGWFSLDDLPSQRVKNLDWLLTVIL